MYVDLDGHPLLVALIVVVFEQSCLSCIIISDFEKAKEDCCVCQKCMRSLITFQERTPCEIAQSVGHKINKQ